MKIHIQSVGIYQNDDFNDFRYEATCEINCDGERINFYGVGNSYSEALRKLAHSLERKDF